ncbi:hypothetical protein LEP1GSC203_2226 [Leptospira terpstrae serovar Hualin str. LT 11-33 = ATCC 700639]|uniref:Uncharacterized protein n=1 Tax=Leptospira terpstrae serovar Hualin str. LT 11-33 = ATCC 700639 TaxID=1257025 RepID=N1VV02_9LEPT|nr:hypothetical protein LEP1GSC203_2226 [Leptospira terpstrae serovar Hualin str. LT 11-33 = ATCC 700639]
MWGTTKFPLKGWIFFSFSTANSYRSGFHYLKSKVWLI